jgi:hypothetical protein
MKAFLRLLALSAAAGPAGATPGERKEGASG